MASDFFRVSQPPSGMYFPCSLEYLLPQSICSKSNSKVPSVSASFCRTSIPALITSGPMPSAGMEAILYVGRLDETPSLVKLEFLLSASLGSVIRTAVEERTASSEQYRSHNRTGDGRYEAGAAKSNNDVPNAARA